MQLSCLICLCLDTSLSDTRFRSILRSSKLSNVLTQWVNLGFVYCRNIQRKEVMKDITSTPSIAEQRETALTCTGVCVCIY